MPKWFKNFGMANFSQNYGFQFFKTILSKKIEKKLEWPILAKIVYSESFEPFWCEKTGRNSGQPILAKLMHSKFFLTILVQKDWKKIRMAKFGCVFKCFLNSFG